MLDPFGPAPAPLAKLVQPLATRLNMVTLPLHAHEVILFALFYQFTFMFVSPIISSYLFPKQYASFNFRTRINWDVHVVSLVQSSFVNVAALYVVWYDEERWAMGWEERIWGYSGAGGLIQAMALGYFLWDLYICTRYLSMFGPGMLAHAVSAVTVFSLGFRPFVNYYGPIFILYELSSPFLNFHWFFDKLNMTGSQAQLYNGLALIGTFFCCRLVWGSYQSFSVFHDIWKAIHSGPNVLVLASKQQNATTVQSVHPSAEVMRFAAEETIPVWLGAAYLASNLTLNALNWFWFEKMIAAVRKRFAPSKEKTKMEIDEDGKGISEEVIKTEVTSGGAQVVEVNRTELRQRT